MDQVVVGNNELAIELFQQLTAPSRNVIFSPFSVSSALAMVYAGAQGATKDQIAAVMRFHDTETFHQKFSALNEKLQKSWDTSSLTLHLANGLWLQQDFQVQEKYLTELKQAYGVGPQRVDFKGDLESARLNINAWVSEQTRTKISELLPQGLLSSFTRLVLANAIYFKASWETPFPEDATRKEAFWKGPEASVEVQMMRLRHDFMYFEDDEVQVIELPYLGKEFSMMIVLPRQKDGLPNLEKALTYQKYHTWCTSMQSKKVILDLPRFELECTTQLEKTLSVMGMPLAFTEKADFSGISAQPLYLSAVIHKAYIIVQEKGTEAAAATAVALAMTSAVRPTMMNVDHPFLLTIRHNPTDSILFLGRVLDP